MGAVKELVGCAGLVALLGTPGAYLQLCAGAVGSVGGFQQGHWPLATVVLMCSLLGVYGLWTIWSISARTWTHGKYVVESDREWARDVRGLLAAWIAVVGFAALSTSIFRVEEVVVFGVLLAPLLLVVTGIACATTPEIMGDSRRLPLSGLTRRIDVRSCAGIAAGLAVGLSGLMFLLPPAPSGWGTCDWSVMFPIEGDLWPAERMTVWHRCSSGFAYQTWLLGVASAVFFLGGLLAVVIGRSPDPLHGAIVAAATALIVLAWRIADKVAEVQAFPLNPLPPVSYYIDWVSTFGIGIAVVLWAACLGYLGGRRGTRFVDRGGVAAD